MARMFCRHNRLTSVCPICSKELEAELPRPAARTRAPGARTATSTARRSAKGGTTGGRLVTKRLVRAEDDGYRNDLVPGCKATADARRLAHALTLATARLEFPGPHPAAAEADDAEEGTWRAFLLVLGAEEVPAWAGGETPEIPGGRRATAEAYRQWAARGGGQAALLAGDAAWSAERRFARGYERLSLPGLRRHDRIEFLLVLGAAGLYAMAQDSLRIERDDDAASAAAKRLLVSGDRGLLDRRARALTDAANIPFGALEHGLALWDAPGEVPESPQLAGSLAAALHLD